MSAPARCVTLLLLLATLPGCSFFIRGSAPRYTDLKTREQVYQTFGPPDDIREEGFVDPAENTVRHFQVEHHHVRKRFDTTFPMGFGLPGVILLMEPYSTTMALYEVAKDYSVGHDIAFVYDDEGTTIGYQFPMPDPVGYRANGPDGINVLNWQRAEETQEPFVVNTTRRSSTRPTTTGPMTTGPTTTRRPATAKPAVASGQ